ncbi:MAG TPA: MmoB/DmpM family protein [Polyangia bacterium]
MEPTTSVEPQPAVGPVLMRGPVGDAVLAAILARSSGGTCIDRGAYVRVLVPGRCVCQRADVERFLGRPFILPADLEDVMPSFKGALAINEDEAVWDAAPRAGQPTP